MAVRVQCPRCKQALAVPAKKVGGYVNCPRCAGRFWVQETPAESPAPAAVSPWSAAPASAGPMQEARPGGAARSTPGPVTPASMTAAVAPAVPAMPPGYVRPMPLPPALTPAPATAAPAAAAPLPAASRKVARLVTSEAVSSNLKLAADGQLPDLHLEQPEKKEAVARQKTVHPAVLFAVLAASVIMTLMLVLMEGEPQPGASAADKVKARREIREQYFGGGKLAGSEELAPYQIYLREAQQAHSRGDIKTERELYRKVLDLLRAASDGRQRGLTGSQKRDEDLEKLIVQLLSEK